MTLVKMKRFEQNEISTIGELEVESSRCWVLERPASGPGCRVPAGVYELGLKTIGTSKFDFTARQLLASKFLGMIELRDVPGRTEILVHWGNSAKDSEGCLLVGESWERKPAGFWLGNSRSAWIRLYPVIADAILGPGGARIEILEEFGGEDAPEDLEIS